MKSVGAIKHKLNQVRFRHLKKRLDAELRPAPNNCQYNVVVPRHHALSSKGVAVDLAAVGVCVVGVRESDPAWPVSHCDDRIDEGARARTCEKFCPRRTKEEIKEDFQKRLDLMTLPEVASHYPDMAALIWVLDVEDLGVPEPPPVEVPPPAVEPVQATMVKFVAEAPPFVQQESAPELETPKKPWYARLLEVL